MSTRKHRDDVSFGSRAQQAPGCRSLTSGANNGAEGLLSGLLACMFVHMRTNGLMILILVTTLLAVDSAQLQGHSVTLLTQERTARGRSSLLQAVQGSSGQDDPEREARQLLLGAKDALSSGNVGFLRPHLGQKVYLNLFTGINGYYSSGQAFLILESLFSTYQPISFSFSSRNFSIRNPYGFGPITFERRGRRETAELFLSLANVNGKWVISQVTIATR
jgi:hypothetical protein